MSDSALPAAVSKMRTVPLSLPPSDIETATSFPSREGAYQSIEVPPFGSTALGSIRTRSLRGSSADSSATRNGCCLGGSSFNAKRTPPRAASAKYSGEGEASSSRTRRAIASRPGSRSSTERAYAFCASLHF